MAAIVNTDYWNSNLTPKNNSSMDLAGIGTAISGIAGAIGTGIAANKNLKAVRETNEANLQLAREQNDWNLGQWYRENEYNSPSAKLERLKAAGLNPLFYGLDGVANANQLTSANLANQQAPQLDVGAIGSSLGHLTDSVIAAGQYHLTKRAQELEERKINIEEKRLGIETDLKNQQIKESEKVIEQMDANIEKIAAEKGYTEAQTENAKKQNELLEAERLKMMEEYEGVKLDNKQKQEFLSQYSEWIQAELNIKKEQAHQLAESAYYYLTSGDYNKASQAGQEMQNELTEEFGYYEHVGGLVSKGASLLSPLLRKAKGLTRLVKGGKAVKAATKAAKGKSEGKKPYVFNFKTNGVANPTPSHSNPTYTKHPTHF